MQKYTGQILAIVFVVLIVTSVIGFALYARIVRDSQRVVDERASIEANELTETITGLLTSSDYDNLTQDSVLNTIYEDLDCLYTADGCRVSNMTLERLKDFLKALGFGEDIFSDFDFDDEYCKVEIAMRYNNENDRLDIEQDYAYSVFLNKVDWNECTSIDFFMKDIDSDGFVVSTFYGNHDGNNEIASYKDYARDDIEGFLYSKTGYNWENYDNSSLNFPANYGVKKGDYDIHEVRFKSLGGSSDLSWKLNGKCDVNGYLFVEVGATCGGKYIGKEFILYGDVFAPPLFDYVLFNGYGNLEMDWDFN